MSKSTKIITSVVAIALVIAAMVVGIYAATSGGATISANVSWQATAGIELTLTGNANNGSVNKSCSATIDTTTTNEDAANLQTIGDKLDINFYDKTTEDQGNDDGVNTAEPITFVYEITNNSTTVPLIVKMTKAPQTNNDKNVSVTSSEAILASEPDNDVYAALTGADTSVTVPANGGKLTITISIDVQHDTQPVESYDAGVIFSFDK